MAFSKDFSLANSELQGICTELMKKFSDLNDKKKVNISVELTGLLKVIFYGASYDKLHENYKLNIFYFLKHLLSFNDVWSLQNGVSFKDKLVLALGLRMMCFNPSTEVITIPELKGKQMYYFICNLFQRHLGLQGDTLKNVVYQGITGCSVNSGIPRRMILYLPASTRYPDKWKVEQAAEMSKVISQWFLLHCNQSTSTPSGKKSGLFQKNHPGATPRTTELDGTAARGIFTVLNIMPTYQGDWLMSIYTFSVLKQWILFLLGSESITDCLTTIPVMISGRKRNSSASFADFSLSPSDSRFNDSGSGSDSVDTQSIASSFMSATESIFADDLYDNLDSSIATSPHQDDVRSQLSFYRSTRSPDSISVTSEISSASSNLKLIAIKYCLRMLSQSEKVPQRISDRSVVSATIVECMHILASLCDNITAISQKAFSEVKRLYARIEAKPLTTRRVYVELLQFFIHHYEAMIIQIDDVLEGYFKEVPSKLYHNQIAAFEVLNLCLRNKNFFKVKSTILSTYFPNIFKLFAWWPCSFLGESCEIIELFTNENNFLETFHAILDLPTLSALLYLKHCNIIDDNVLLGQKLGVQVKPYFSAMFSFLLREKSGGGETIDRLSEVHTALELLGSHPRVRYASDIVPAMLISFFSVLEKCGKPTIAQNIFPVLLERCFQLYPKNDGTKEILEIFAQSIQMIAKLAPDVISCHLEEILTFFSHIHSTTSGFMPLLCSVIWCIGEFVPSSELCSRKQVTVLYETLETMLYEASGTESSSKNILASPEVVTSLISALSKLAAYSQELIPRAIVSLNKISTIRKETFVQGLGLADRLAVTTFAQEMIHLLQKPKVAPLILCHRRDVIPWHLGTDSSVSMTVRVLSKHADINAQ